MCLQSKKLFSLLNIYNPKKYFLKIYLNIETIQLFNSISRNNLTSLLDWILIISDNILFIRYQMQIRAKINNMTRFLAAKTLKRQMFTFFSKQEFIFNHAKFFLLILIILYKFFKLKSIYALQCATSYWFCIDFTELPYFFNIISNYY